MPASKGILLIKMCDCSFLNPFIFCFPLLASHSSPDSVIFQIKQAFLSEPASFSTHPTLSQTHILLLFLPSSSKWESEHERGLIKIPLPLSQESVLWEREDKGFPHWNPTRLTMSTLTFCSSLSFKFLWSSSSEKKWYINYGISGIPSPLVGTVCNVVGRVPGKAGT